MSEKFYPSPLAAREITGLKNHIAELEAENARLRELQCAKGALVYLATPYSHPDADVSERRFREVNRVAGDMIRHGAHVFSPISHTHPIALAGDLPKAWEFWQAYDRAMLGVCSKLVVLMQDGWQESVGVQAESAIAKEMGLPIEFLACYSTRKAAEAAEEKR